MIADMLRCRPRLLIHGGPAAGERPCSGTSARRNPLRAALTYPPQFPWNSTDVVKNPWSWTKLGNVMWVDQPVGTGFARGDRTAANQEDVAADFAAFLVNYFSVFQNMKGKKLWLTGESYAGKYIPYMANYIYKHPSLKRQGINLQGIAINDPSWAADLALEELPAYDFAKRNRDVLHLDDAFFATLEPKLEAARIKTFLEDNLKYPPRGPIYAPKTYDMNVFSPWSDVYEAAYDKNNCFNGECPRARSCSSGR